MKKLVLILLASTLLTSTVHAASEPQWIAIAIGTNITPPHNKYAATNRNDTQDKAWKGAEAGCADHLYGLPEEVRKTAEEAVKKRHPDWGPDWAKSKECTVVYSKLFYPGDGCLWFYFGKDSGFGVKGSRDEAVKLTGRTGAEAPVIPLCHRDDEKK
jgi:hypothetical protein